MLRPRKLLAHVTLGLAAGALLGCPAFQYRDRDIDRTPTVNTGAGATIIMPGQTVPAQQPATHPQRYGGVPQQGHPPQQGTTPYGTPPAPTYGSPEATPGAGGGGGGNLTMLGSSEIDEKKKQKVREAPVYWKYVTLPFAIVAAPFVYAAEAVRGEPEAGPEVPTVSNQPPPPPPAPAPMDYETQQLQNLERELARREPAPAPQGVPTPRRAGGGATSSIADELAALQRAPVAPTPLRHSTAQPSSAASTSQPERDPALASASGIVDRNDDGRADHWIYRQDGQLTRESYDEDFDGRPDRTLHYDAASHQVKLIEEDANLDGHVDSWTAFREGKVLRRRVDSDDDGHVDSWSFYRNGTITRLERDSDADGFRDHLAFYEDGKLAREERDDDADGRPDLVKHYDSAERVARVEEDANGDGQMDVVSHYEGGRLLRRELLDASMLDGSAPSEVN